MVLNPPGSIAANGPAFFPPSSFHEPDVAVFDFARRSALGVHQPAFFPNPRKRVAWIASWLQ
jgi:hypothetical protein